MKRDGSAATGVGHDQEGAPERGSGDSNNRMATTLHKEQPGWNTSHRALLETAASSKQDSTRQNGRTRRRTHNQNITRAMR